MIFLAGPHADAGTSRPSQVAVSLADAVEIILAQTSEAGGSEQ
jgi:hypothetical protein